MYFINLIVANSFCVYVFNHMLFSVTPTFCLSSTSFVFFVVTNVYIKKSIKIFIII